MLVPPLAWMRLMSPRMRARLAARCRRTTGAAWLSKTMTAIRSDGGIISAVARAASLVSSILGPPIEPDLSMTSASASVASSSFSGRSRRTGRIASRRLPP